MTILLRSYKIKKKWKKVVPTSISQQSSWTYAKAQMLRTLYRVSHGWDWFFFFFLSFSIASSPEWGRPTWRVCNSRVNISPVHRDLFVSQIFNVNCTVLNIERKLYQKHMGGVGRKWLTCLYVLGWKITLATTFCNQTWFHWSL